jgi:hypothetical protein
MRTIATQTGRKTLLIVILCLGLAVALQAWPSEPAAAHGKEVEIAITPLVADPSRPLHRLYRVQVLFANDHEPVEGATVVLTARRDDGSEGFPALTLKELGSGLYAGEVVFARFGVWDMEVRVRAELSQGEGDVAFTEDIRPGALTPDAERALQEEAERVIRLQLSFGFGWWPDVMNIAMRALHSGAGASYFALMAVVFGLAWFGTPARQPRLRMRLARWFLPGACLSLGLLLGAGLYSARFDAPITSPGIYDLQRMREIPYGEWYLAAFFSKVVLFLVLGALTYRTHSELQRPGGPAGALEEPAGALRWVTLAAMSVGGLLVVNVATLIYLHYVSHLAVFLPES